MRSKVSSVLLALIMLMSFLPADTLGSEINEAKSTLLSYLSATQKGDINQMIALSNDSRIGPDVSGFDFYKEILNNPSEQLADYKILTQEVLSPISYKFVTILTFKNGGSSQVPFKLSHDNGKWKVILGPKSLEDPKYKVLKGKNQISGINLQHLLRLLPLQLLLRN